LSKNLIPKHVAIIMDGNGRWAKKRLLPRPAGHKAGLKAAKIIVEAAAEQGVEYLTLFVFSSENWRRPPIEVEAILKTFVSVLTSDIDKLHRNNLKLKVVGDITSFPETIQKAIAHAESLTAQNTGMTVILAANYGGLWDITQASKQLIRKVMRNELSIDEITESHFAQCLSTNTIPNPDLFIRTSGEQRLSNFYLWQLSYSELYFTSTAWPDFNKAEFQKALDFYAGRERRYGYASEQLEEKHVKV